MKIKKDQQRAVRYKQLSLFTLLVCTSLLFGGCAGKQADVMLPSDIPATWTGGELEDEFPATSSKILDLLSDEAVTAIAREALENNPDLGAAGDRLMAQAALLGVTRAQIWPSVDLGLINSRAKTDGVSTGEKGTFYSHQMDIGVSWELDVWGKIRDRYRGEQSGLLVNRLEYEAARDSLIVRTIQAWIRTMSLAKSIEIAGDRIDNLEAIQERILYRYRDGIGSIDELSTANTHIYSAKAERTELVELHAQCVRDLEILLGRYPENLLTPGASYPVLELPKLFQPGEVLTRRPDVQAALEQVRGAASQLSAAEKSYLPSFVLTGKLFSEETKLSDILSGSILWEMILATSQPLFTAGRIEKEIEARKWEREATVKNLRSVVLKATGEVRQYWGIEQMLGRKESLLQAAGLEATRSYEYFEKRYLEGLDPISNMLNAKEEQISIHLQINELQAARLNNRLELALALGMGEGNER